MRVVVIVLLAVILLSTPVLANNYYHEMSIVVEGEYKLTTNIAVPDVTQSIDVEGVGRVMIDTKLKKFGAGSWWDLF